MYFVQAPCLTFGALLSRGLPEFHSSSDPPSMALVEDPDLQKVKLGLEIYNFNNRIAQLEETGVQCRLRQRRFLVAREAFGITALLQAILIHLPSYDVIRSRRIHADFQSTIHGSPTLHQGLDFSRAKPAYQYLVGLSGADRNATLRSLSIHLRALQAGDHGSLSSTLSTQPSK